MANKTVLVSCLDESQEFQRTDAEEARRAGAGLGLDVHIVYCHGDPVRQVKQIGEAVQAEASRRPVAIMLHPVAVSGLEGLARSTLRAGVGWISLEPAFYLETIQREFPDQLVALVATDNREVGRLQARLIRTLLPAGGSVISLEGPSLSSAVMDRRDGMKEALAGSNVTILRTLTGDWSEASGERAMSFWLRMGKAASTPALVASQNDLMAAGARKAIRQLKPDWDQVLFTGVDGLPEGGQRLVREGLLAGTVVQPLMAPAAIQLVARWVRGEKDGEVSLPAPSLYPPLGELGRGGRAR